MEPGIIIVLLILGVTVIMLVLDLVRIDIVAIGCMLALGWTGILNPQEMFSGFSSNAVIAVLGYCPGTIAGAIGNGYLDAIVGGLAGIVLGTWIFAVMYPKLRDGILKKAISAI